MPYKNEKKQKHYTREYQRTLRTRAKEQQTLDEINKRIVQVARKVAIGRQLYHINPVPKKSNTSMLGISKIPIIHADFEFGSMQSAEEATLKVMEAEDTLLLTGEHVGWNAMGLEGLATAKGRSLLKSTGNWFEDVDAAITLLQSYTLTSPFKVVLNTKWRNFIEEELHKPNYLYSPNLFDRLGSPDIALVVKPSPKNFTLLCAQDLIAINGKQGLGKVWEAIAPRIDNPKAICEIGGLSALS